MKRAVMVTMHPLISSFRILRPVNVLMSGAAVALGAWLSGGIFEIRSVVLLVIAAISASSYGNVVNDIMDIETDKISHPNRPLPRNILSINTAVVLALFLCTFSLVNAFLVNTAYGIGTLAPLALLTLYAFYFKGTPLFGNILVSALVAYSLVFGGLCSPLMHRLIVPAILAFLLNFAREIVKDVQDETGDKSAGLTTTSILSKHVLKIVLYVISALYMLLLFVPCFLHQFGYVYLLVCILFTLQLHLYWLMLVNNSRWTSLVSKISSLVKWEMLAGLLALSADQLFLGMGRH
jgi:geranylgeranylglycerol-phosphate geranylgeranyltransferase